MKLHLAIIFCALASGVVCKSLSDEDDDDRQDGATTEVYVEPRQDEPTEVVVEPRLPLDVVPVDFYAAEKEANQLDRLLSASCNGATVAADGTSATNSILVQSTNYPSSYPNSQNCMYSISVPANSQLLISISAINTECPYDYVQFAFNSNPPVSTLCPLSSAARMYTVSPQPAAYTFRVLFTSDSTITYSGFSINVYLNATGSPTTAPPTTLPPTTTAKATTTAVVTTTTTKPATTTTVAPGTCTCGRWGVRRDAEGRIVGGSIAAPHSVPYQVGVWTTNSANPFCGGTIISKNYVLTAAHCTEGFIASQLRVAVNDVKYTVKGDGEIYINVKTIKRHPNYDTNTQDDDFSLLELVSPAPISSTVGIACLPPDVTQTFAGTTLTISGWGTTSSSGTQSADLKVGTVVGQTNSACASVYGTITANMICAGTANFDTDTCQGDSGGPLVTSVNGKATLVGVTSFGSGCAMSPYPGVYARVSAQKSWILANSDAGQCQN